MTPPAAQPTSPAGDLASARQVLRTEAEALLTLAEALDGDFERAVDLLARVEGRVVCTGMGKSGHVARKIAATLASTGTPAFFVHPAEASHGDLGMITKSDAVIALSNSGETPELADVLTYTRRFAIPLIAMTSRAASALAEASDVPLVLPKVPEACPLGLAPTTSTTLMLALGDALAVALLERKNFSAADFRLFHPGGQLGRRLLKVADLMHTPPAVPLAAPGMMMGEAIIEMTSKAFGCVGVVDEAGVLVGIVTDGDLRRHLATDLLQQTVGEVMTRSPRSIKPGALAAEALRIMNERSITSLFVTDEDGRPAGILHVHDLLRAGVV